jgi:AcrR family transcriptional regulator
VFDGPSIHPYTWAMLTTERVVQAGLALVADQGLTALGVRALSSRLGVTPMALYRHIGSAEQLEHDVLGAILDEVPLVDPNAPWEEACQAWARAARSVLSTYPGVAQHVLTRCFELPPMLKQLEALLSAALASGRRGFEAVASANAVLMHVLMRVEAETAVRRAGSVRRALREVRARPRDYPALHEHLAHYEVARFDEHFDYGLSVLLAGQCAALEPSHGSKHAHPRR